MIAWLSPSASAPLVPAALEGWEGRPGVALWHRDTQDGHVVGVGDPLVWSRPRRWEPISDGWSVAMVPGTKFDPLHLARAHGWCEVRPVEDIQRRQWLAPVIRRPGGGRAFTCAYGRDWLPALSPEQIRAEEICAATLDAINQDTPMAVACQWTAELLSLTHHVCPELLAALALIDGVLAVAVLRESASVVVEAPA